MAIVNGTRPRLLDQVIPGAKFGHLIVLRPMPRVENVPAKAECRCECCGRTREIRSYALLSGDNVTCGSRDCQSLVRHENLSGQRFGRLVVEYRVVGDDKSRWMCKCDCGTLKPCRASHLKSGNIRSCGCISRDGTNPRCRRHGKTGTSEYHTWQGMIDRCHNPNSDGWHNYGGRGIVVCERYRGSFEAFFADLGDKPSRSHSIDRKNNDVGYCCGSCDDCLSHGWPFNCRWATYRQQHVNKRCNHRVTYNDETKTISEWSEIVGIAWSTIFNRLEHGWPVHLALTVAPDKQNRLEYFL